MPLKRGLGKATQILSHRHLAFKICAGPAMRIKMAIGTERDQVAFVMIPSACNMVNDEMTSLGISARFASESSCAPNSLREASCTIIRAPAQASISYRSALAAAESSRAALEPRTTRDDFPTELTGAALNTGERTIVLACAEGINTKLLAACRANLIDIIGGIPAAFGAISLADTGPQVVSLKRSKTNGARIHASTV